MDTVDLCSDSERSMSPNDHIKEYDFIGSLSNIPLELDDDNVVKDLQTNTNADKLSEDDLSNDTIPWGTSDKETKPPLLHVISSDSDEDMGNVSLLHDIHYNVPNGDAMSYPSTSTSSSLQTKSSSDVLSTDSGEMERKGKRKSRGNKENKDQERKERKRIREEILATKPGECMKFIRMECSSDLLSAECFSKVFEVICPTGVLIKPRHEHRSSVTWSRKSLTQHLQHNEGEVCLSPIMSSEPHIAIILQQSQVVELLKSRALSDHIKSLQQCHMMSTKEGTLTLILYGMENYFRKNKNKDSAQWKRNIGCEENGKGHEDKGKHLTENDMDYYLAKLLLDDGISWCRAETPDDLANLLLHLTKAVAEAPYKRNKYQQDLEADFYMRGDNRDCVRVDANGNGLLRLWSQSLCKFPHAGLEVGQAVCQRWNSPLAICQTLQRLEGGVSEAVTLLGQIPVRRDKGPMSGSKRLGPELSKKLYTYFTASDGDTLLS